jgi:hypothetical protein
MAKIEIVLSALDILAAPLSAKKILVIALHDKVLSLFFAKKYDEVHICKFETRSAQNIIQVHNPVNRSFKKIKCDNLRSLPYDDSYFDSIIFDRISNENGKSISSEQNARFNEWIDKNKKLINIELSRILSVNGVLLKLKANKLSPYNFKKALGFNTDNGVVLKVVKFLNCAFKIIKILLLRLKTKLLCFIKRSWINHKIIKKYILKINNGEINDIIDYSIYNDKKNKQDLSNGLKQRLKQSRFFLKYFEGAKCAVYYNTTKVETVCNCIVQDISQALNYRYNLKNKATYFITNKGVMCIIFEEIIIKIGLNPVTVIQLEKNCASIKLIKTDSNIPGQFKLVIPELLFDGVNSNLKYCVEELMPGLPAVTYADNDADFDTILKNALKLVQELHVDTRKKRISNDIIRLFISERINYIKLLLDNKYEKTVLMVSDYLNHWLNYNNLPSVFQKGDCGANNILVAEDLSISAIIDWDQALSEGLPLIDILNLIESFKRYRLKKEIGIIMIEYFFPNKLSENENEFLKKYCNDMEISIDFLKPLSIIYWLIHVFEQNNSSIAINNESWVKNNIIQVINYLEKNLT